MKQPWRLPFTDHPNRRREQMPEYSDRVADERSEIAMRQEHPWSAIPAVHSSAEPGALRQVARRSAGLTRRRFIRSAIVLGGAAALGVLDFVGSLGGTRAAATVGSEHAHCAGYDGWSGYNNNTAKCVGGYYSSFYCGSDKWFKNGLFGSTQYTPVKACGDGSWSDDKRNAWRWTHSGTPYRCADGVVCSSQQCVFRICSASNP